MNLFEAAQRDMLLLEVQRGNEQIHALHSSLSWRLTAPLRWIADRLGVWESSEF